MGADPDCILVCILFTVFFSLPTKLMKASDLLLKIIRFLHTRFYSLCVCVFAEKMAFRSGRNPMSLTAEDRVREDVQLRYIVLT